MKFRKSLIIAFMACWTLQSDVSAMGSGGSLFTIAGTSQSQWVSIDSETGGGTVVGPTGVDTIFGTAYDPVSNQLLGSFENRLFEIDPETGVATVLVNLVASPDPAQFAAVSALAFDTSTNTLFGINQGSASGIDELITIDRDSGEFQSVGVTGFRAVAGLEYDPFGDRLLAVSTDDATILTIDRVTGAASSPFSNGSLSVGSASLAINTATGDAFGLNLFSGELESVDLQTGLSTRIGPASDTGFAGVIGLVFVPSAIPEPTPVALLGLGCLLASHRRRRSCA
ncbi:PEP-CTERM sorting domain-containing protein [Mariniblastus sp.]|nr:PEP-CTERM sorting domain-containing protein [Mariniblastus sp.]